MLSCLVLYLACFFEELAGLIVSLNDRVSWAQEQTKEREARMINLVPEEKDYSMRLKK